MMLIWRVLTMSILVVSAPFLAAAQPALDQEKTGLPSPATQQAIKGLTAIEPIAPSIPKTLVQRRGIKKQDFRQYNVTADKIPKDRSENLSFDSEGKASVPIAAPNTMILQFEPNVSESDMQAFLKERKLKVVRTYAKIGAIQVQGDFSSYFVPQLADNSANDALLRGFVAAIQDFQSDPRIRSATPDLVLRDQVNHGSGGVQITNLLTPSDVVLSDPSTAVENTDWGISDIQADGLWVKPGANDGILFGVMDVGFTRHEDLVFLELPPETAVNDHGNHVAAIACGKHGNGRGVRGVLPNCFVRARSGNIFFDSDEGSAVLQFVVLFSQVLATLEQFVDSQDDVQTFNVSLGYNWQSNFGINPDLPESAQWRTIVASQGAFLVPMLELANHNGRVIFSAAGNDSSGLATPIGAKFASPFNWAAITAREEGIAENGVIVEAHDKNGTRGSFSNTGGHISCPGVDVFSAVAFDPQGQISESAYGTMSGTSMASPYCAAGHLLFKLVRPGYSGIEAIACMTQSPETSSSGTPMLRLQSALVTCPPKT